MSDSNQDINGKKENPYKNKVNKWVIWATIAVIIFVILLLVFNRRSTAVNEEAESDSPIALMTINSDYTCFFGRS